MAPSCSDPPAQETSLQPSTSPETTAFLTMKPMAWEVRRSLMLPGRSSGRNNGPSVVDPAREVDDDADDQDEDGDDGTCDETLGERLVPG